MRRTGYAVALVFFTVLLSLVGFAQSDQTGFSTFSSYMGDINLSNLNEMLTIPIFSKPGRGIPVNYALHYNSSIYSVISNFPNNPPLKFYITPAISCLGCSFLPTFGWDANGFGAAYVTSSSASCGSGTKNTNFAFIDAHGTAHPLPSSVFTASDPSCGPAQASGYATDQSGYFITAHGSGSGAAQNTAGSTFTFSGYPVATLVTDRNGNTLSANVQTSIATDTLGVTALSISSTLDSSGNTSSVTYTYPAPNGVPASLTVNYKVYPAVASGFACPNVGEYTSLSGPINNLTSAAPLVDNIVFADGSKYTFQYEQTPGGSQSGAVTGRLSSVTLPTGATVAYSYLGPNGGVNCTDGTTLNLSRTTLDGTTTYSRSVATDPNAVCSAGVCYHKQISEAVTITDPQGNQTVVNFMPLTNPQSNTFSLTDTNWIETQRQIFQGSSSNGKLLQTSTRCYNGNKSNCASTAVTMPITEISKILKIGNGKQSEEDVFLDSVTGVVKEVDEYDLGTNGPGLLMKKTVISYASLGNNIVSLPAGITVCQPGGSDASCNGVGTTGGKQIAQTTYSYDESAPTPTSGVPQHVAVSGSRGNVTSVHTWLNTSNSFLNVGNTFDDTGDVLSTTDANGNKTSFAYGCSNAFVNQVTMPSTGVAHITSVAYDCNTGLLSTLTDQNGNLTKYFYDSMFRSTEIDYPDGGQRTASYPSLVETDTKTKMDSTRFISAIALKDGYGRTTQIQEVTPDCSTNIKVDTSYDALGRVANVSNPYCLNTDSTYGITSSQYDALGHVTAVTEQDGSIVTTQYDQLAAVSSNATCSISADEAGNQRQTCFDGMGRIIEVDEPGDPASTGLAHPSVTLYAYDALNNLLQVSQHGNTSDTTQWRTRQFAYDSLSRLITATTPESGTICYGILSGGTCINGYDGNGNLLNKTDARGTTSSYTYDALNRMTHAAYSNGDNSDILHYDETSSWGSALSNTVGRLTTMYRGNTGAVFNYDAMGRTIEELVCTPHNCGTSNYDIRAQYDLAGNMVFLHYPSTHEATYHYNSANRLDQAQLTGWNGGQPDGGVYTYLTVSDTNFYPNGVPKTWTLANSMTESTVLNNRLQLREKIITNPSMGTFADHVFSYGTQNNGNILSASDQLNGSRTQSFTYDSLSRLATAAEGRWGLSFVYDPWGNRLQQNVTAGSAGMSQLTVNGNNQVNGYRYDTSGNLLNDGFHAYAYDAHNRITTVDSSVFYTYNATGNRARKDYVSGAPSNEYVYFNGQVIAEMINTTTEDWDDYIFANGRRIAKTASYEDRILIQGTNSSAGQSTGFTLGGIAWLPYAVQNGDRLMLRQKANAGQGGVIINFRDGTSTRNVLRDTDGQLLNSDGMTGFFHYRRADLSAYAGKTISSIALISETTSGAGAWLLKYADFVLVSLDGTVRPIYTNESAASLTQFGGSGVTGISGGVDHISNSGDPTNTTWFYHQDQINSSRLLSANEGWPVWQGTFLPFGEEYSPQITTNHYKFTGDEHDAETNLEHTLYRQYSGTMGRWLTPDPAGTRSANPANPQSWNRYTYAKNNPINAIDHSGLEDDGYGLCGSDDCNYSGLDNFGAEGFGSPEAGPDDNGTGLDNFGSEGFGRGPDDFGTGLDNFGAGEGVLSDGTGMDNYGAEGFGQKNTVGSAAVMGTGKDTVVVFLLRNGVRVALTGTPAFRNQNPGNIEFRRRNGSVFPGALNNDGRFAIFPGEMAGFEALDYLLSTGYLNSSIDSMMESYAPGFENNTQAYAAFLANTLSVPGSTTVGDLFTEQYGNFMNAIASYEGFYGAQGYSNTITITPP